MKLITEIIDRVEFLTEKSTDGNKWFIEGKMIHGGNNPNKNKRIYEMDSVLRPATRQYIENYVTKNRALGELNHPAHPQVNPERACIVVKNLTERSDGTGYNGKAQIIERSPLGQIVIGIMEAGGEIGVSTRALGSLKTGANGVDYVQNDLKFSAIDVVSDPSGLDCFVNGIMESANWEMVEDGRIVQLAVDKTKNKITEAKAMKAFAELMLKFGQK